MKICTKCGESKSLDDFSNKTGRKDGKASYCLVCGRIANKKWREANLEIAKENARESSKRYYYAKGTVFNRLRKYKLTEEQFNNLMTSTDGSCGICASKENLVIDHCHRTKRVRGILCSKCNTGLGKLGDDKESLIKAIKYLEAGGQVSS